MSDDVPANTKKTSRWAGVFKIFELQVRKNQQLPNDGPRQKKWGCHPNLLLFFGFNPVIFGIL